MKDDAIRQQEITQTQRKLVQSLDSGTRKILRQSIALDREAHAIRERTIKAAKDEPSWIEIGLIEHAELDKAESLIEGYYADILKGEHKGEMIIFENVVHHLQKHCKRLFHTLAKWVRVIPPSSPITFDIIAHISNNVSESKDMTTTMFASNANSDADGVNPIISLSMRKLCKAIFSFCNLQRSASQKT